MNAVKKLVSVPVASLLLLSVVGPVDGATTGTSDVILEASSTAEINIVDASITLTPNQTDYETGYVSAEGAAGIDVQIRTNSSTGAILRVQCADAVPEITLTDLLFKTQTAPIGAGATSQNTYTAITAADQDLWDTTVSAPTYTTIQTDIRVQNLWDYPDPGGAGTTTYTNTLTYTVVVQ
jgi:hypothetical protein